MRIFLTILFIIILSACSSRDKNNNELSYVVESFFNVYSQRNDFERLISFYDNNAQFEDIIYGASFKSKAEIKGFLAWDKGEFQLLSGERILTVTKQVLDKNIAVTEGFFHEFSYDGQKLGPWLFVIVQEFNTQNKIIKQTDWINYTPRENFLDGKNMNHKLINDKLIKK